MTPSLGPDATGVGWVYEYALIAKERSLAELRSLQDWSLRYGLSKAEGVAEIASVGGFVKQYNVVIDPQRLRSFDIPLSDLDVGTLSTDTDIKRALAGYLNVAEAKFRDYTVDRHETGNLTVRPEAVFG